MRKHYLDLKDKPFYDGLCKYMSSAPVLAMVTRTHTRTRTRTHARTHAASLLVGVSSGVGGAEHCETGPDDAGRDQPGRVQARQHPGRPVHRHRQVSP